MKRLEFKKEHHAGKLMEELLEIIELQPVEKDGEKQAVFSFKHDGDNIYLRVPDNAPEDEIKDIIEKHDSTPPPLQPDPDEELEKAINEVIADLPEDDNVRQLGEALLGQRGAGRAKGRPI